MLSRLTALAAASPLSVVLLLVACAYLLVIAVWLSVIDLRSHIAAKPDCLPVNFACHVATGDGILDCGRSRLLTP